ncbi:MAG: tetratricopeptide repeat protein, partial [Terriglobales bacterium]
ALNINPSSVPDLVALGYAYEQDDDYQKAEAALVTALALQRLTLPDIATNSPARLELMRALTGLLLDEGRYGEAVQQSEQVCIGTKGSDSEAMDLFVKAQSTLLRDLTGVSAKALMDAYHALPAEQQAQSRMALIDTLLDANRPDLALPLMDEQQKGLPDGKPDEKLILSRARAFMQNEKFADAQNLVQAMLTEKKATYKSLSEALVILSQSQLGLNDLPAGEDAARKAVEAYSKNFDAYIQLARACVKRGKFQEGIDWAKKALEINQYATRAFLVQGDAMLAQNKVKEASEQYQRAEDLYPGLVDTHRAMLCVYTKLNKKEEIKREQDQITEIEKQK